MKTNIVFIIIVSYSAVCKLIIIVNAELVLEVKVKMEPRNAVDPIVGQISPNFWKDVEQCEKIFC